MSLGLTLAAIPATTQSTGGKKTKKAGKYKQQSVTVDDQQCVYRAATQLKL